MRAERLIALLMTLQRAQAMTAGELAQRLDVSVRTIFRDIDTLSTMGVPVYTEAGRGGGIRLMEGYSSDLTGLSSGEAEALALIASPASVGVRDLATPMLTAMDKLAAAVPTMHQLRAQHARSRLLFDTKPWFRAQDTSPFLDELRGAIWKDETIAIDYRRSDGQLRDYVIDAYALVVKVDTWYLIGRVKGEMRVFRVSRMLSLARTGERFERSESFDLQKFWGHWCEQFERSSPRSLQVRLNVSARGRQLLLDGFGFWFRGALEPLGEDYSGRREVTLDMECEDTALRVLFMIAPEADILEPPSLREKLHVQAQRVVLATADAPEAAS